jgi:polyhydroxyalkanoate synthesis regulator phasin
VQPNNDLTEFTINNRMYDDKTNELMSIENDISLGQHDIRIVSGSTLPSNKMAEYNMYLDAYKLGLVDDVEVLKKTEIYDKEGVLQRKGAMSQMQSYIQQLEEQVKKLSGDLQTSEREAVNARKQTITQKFKSGLDSVLNDIKDKERKNLNKLENVIDKADLQAKYGKKQGQGIQGAEQGVEG